MYQETLATWLKWNGTNNPDGRFSGSVCGQDPRFQYQMNLHMDFKQLMNIFDFKMNRPKSFCVHYIIDSEILCVNWLFKSQVAE